MKLTVAEHKSVYLTNFVLKIFITYILILVVRQVDECTMQNGLINEFLV